VALLGALTACVSEAPPSSDFEWAGEWIDIVGQDRLPIDTCAGTFEYLDSYAGVLAAEFGVSSHLGLYRWYSRERFEAEDPCGEPVGGCTGQNGVFTHLMPLEHEVVHVVSNAVTLCPSVLTEGLAEYYGTTSEAPTGGDIDALIEASEHGAIPSSGYPLAGAFAAYLVQTHGLDEVLALCELAGPYPNLEAFSQATSAALGVSLEQVLVDFETFECGFDQYQSKLYECGLEPAVVVSDAPVEFEIHVDCASATTIGPRADEIWTLQLARVLEAGSYLVELVNEDGVAPTVELRECAACVDTPHVHRFGGAGGPTVEPLQLNARDYVVRASVEPRVAGDAKLRFTKI
jgi:hypothetical protein